MVSPSMRNLQEISIILNRGKNQSKVSQCDIENAIRTVVGSDKRTIRHYIDLLLQEHVIIWVDDDMFDLDVSSVIHAWQSNVYNWLLGGLSPF